MSGWRRLGLLLGGTTVLSGCSFNLNLTAADLRITAACPRPGTHGNPTLTLMAQAVPTATLIPCIQSVPTGWSLGDPDFRRGRATFSFISDVDRSHPVTVRLASNCRIRGATEVPSDQAGARRFERAIRLTAGYAGERYYRYPGGCTTYRFDLHGPTRAEALNQISLALDFVSRDVIRRSVSRELNGRLHLDPTPAGRAS